MAELHCAGCRCAEIADTETQRIARLVVEGKLKTGAALTDDELIYAAYDRCECGEGMAYPKNCPLNHYWDCAGILTHRAALKGQPGARRHSARMPFTFYEVKSENQPSAAGATTRPRAA